MSDLASILLYLSSFAACALLVYFGQKNNQKLFTILGLLIPILLCGLWNNVGIDYNNYVRLFERSNELDYAAFSESNGFWTVEPSFYIFSRISMFLTGSSWLLFTIYSSIIVVFFFLALKRLKTPYLGMSMFLYLTIYFLFNMSLMRQGAAISVSFFAATYLLDKKYLPFIGIVLLASLFHFSALLMLLMIPITAILKRDKSNLLTIGGIALVGILIISLPSLIDIVSSLPLFDKYVYLSNKGREEIFIGQTFLLQLGIMLLCLFLYKKTLRVHREVYLLFPMMLIGIVAYSLNFRINYASRLSYYFLISSSVILPYSVSLFKEKHMPLLLLAVMATIYFVKIYYMGASMMLFPYQFIWES